jgi:hypothetical protein
MRPPKADPGSAAQAVGLPLGRVTAKGGEGGQLSPVLEAWTLSLQRRVINAYT